MAIRNRRAQNQFSFSQWVKAHWLVLALVGGIVGIPAGILWLWPDSPPPPLLEEDGGGLLLVGEDAGPPPGTSPLPSSPDGGVSSSSGGLTPEELRRKKAERRRQRSQSSSGGDGEFLPVEVEGPEEGGEILGDEGEDEDEDEGGDSEEEEDSSESKKKKKKKKGKKDSCTWGVETDWGTFGIPIPGCKTLVDSMEEAGETFNRFGGGGTKFFWAWGLLIIGLAWLLPIDKIPIVGPRLEKLILFFPTFGLSIGSFVWSLGSDQLPWWMSLVNGGAAWFLVHQDVQDRVPHCSIVGLVILLGWGAFMFFA